MEGQLSPDKKKNPTRYYQKCKAVRQGGIVWQKVPRFHSTERPSPRYQTFPLRHRTRTSRPAAAKNSNPERPADRNHEERTPRRRSSHPRTSILSSSAPVPQRARAVSFLFVLKWPTAVASWTARLFRLSGPHASELLLQSPPSYLIIMFCLSF